MQNILYWKYLFIALMLICYVCIAQEPAPSTAFLNSPNEIERFFQASKKQPYHLSIGGKSWLVNIFGQEFDHFIAINFETHPNSSYG